MNYILTQEELDKLGGNREAMRKEYDAILKSKLDEFANALTKTLRTYSGNDITRYHSSISDNLVLSAVRDAMHRCKIEPTT